MHYICPRDHITSEQAGRLAGGSGIDNYQTEEFATGVCYYRKKFLVAKRPCEPMTKDDKPRKPAAGAAPEPGPDMDDDKFGDSASDGRPQEPFFADFDDEEVYEEPDRDTDYASAYQEEEIDDDEYPLPPALNGEAEPGQWLDAEADELWIEDDASEEDNDSWTELESPTTLPETDAATTWRDAAPLLAQSEQADDMEEDYSMEDAEEEWEDDEQDYDEDQEYQDDHVDHEESVQNWPIGLILVALVALALLAAGGYGVIQQRSAMEEEIRQLRASLAIAANPAEVASSREALQELNQRNTDQLAAIDALTLENRRLTDIVAGLESQLEAQREAVKTAEATKAAEVKPVAAKPAATKPATPEPAATSAAGGDWFVNFGTYSQRELAQSWANKLRPASGKVIVAPAKKNGASIYRVRVTGLPSRDEAEKISRQLESRYGLPKLWVGKQQ